ncbi:MAG TPA: hypothetical protein VGE75_03700, partial [Acidimicrobiales bacterium]
MTDAVSSRTNPDIGGEVTKLGAKPYPAELECDIVTVTGVKLHMRPIRPDDAQSLVNFHLQLSSGSIYRRYFAVHPELSPKEVEHLTTVDYAD